MIATVRFRPCASAANAQMRKSVVEHRVELVLAGNHHEPIP
jgi:hypothetical protein